MDLEVGREVVGGSECNGKNYKPVCMLMEIIHKR